MSDKNFNELTALVAEIVARHETFQRARSSCAVGEEELGDAIAAAARYIETARKTRDLPPPPSIQAVRDLAPLDAQPSLHGDVMSIDLWYPHLPDAKVRAIQIGLTAVRATDDIRVRFDFERNGWSIEQASIFEWPADDPVCDADWQEVAFVEPYGREAPVGVFEQLEQREQWGHRTLHWPDGTEAKFVDGESVEALWPNGFHDDDARITIVPETQSVYDHGRQSDITSQIPYVSVDVRGVRALVPLLNLKVLRSSVKGRKPPP